MILFLNVKITTHRKTASIYNSIFSDERIDVFKYCLSSLSVLLPLISKVFLNVELSEEYESRKNEIKNYIEKTFPKDILVLKTTRNSDYPSWKETCDQLNSVDDNIVWYCGNDDHIFIDSSLDIIKNGLDLLKNEKDPMSFLYYSHWPEQMRLATHVNAELDKDKNFVKFRWGRYDSISVLRKERFNEYWSIPHCCGVHRSDELMYCRPNEIIGNNYSPTKEIVRHFDGYNHVGHFNNSCPFLSIPKGFFENNIKIKYGYDTRDDDYTNINPASENFFTHNRTGTDYKWCLEDIPLFWKDKIKEININPNTDLQKLKQKRNEFFYTKPIESCKNAYEKNGYEKMPPKDWFVKHII